MIHFARLVAIAVLLAIPIATHGESRDVVGTWKGILTATDGTSAEVQVDFGSQGFPLYSYTNNRGVTRQVELTQVGQSVEYVPSGGGVQRLVVRSLERDGNRLAVGISGSFEKAAHGYLDQRYEEALFEYVLTPTGLHMKVTTEERSHFGDTNNILSGQPTVTVAEGLLQRAP